MKKTTLLTLLAASALAATASAQTIVSFDQVYRVEDNKTTAGQAGNGIGNSGGTTAADQQVFFVSFVLPDLGGNPITAADLEINITGVTNAGYNADLYAVRLTDSTGDVTNANPNPDHQTGSDSLTWDNTAFAPTPASIKIQDNFLTEDSTTGLTGLDSTGQSNLLDYLDDNYEVGGVVYFALAADETGVGANHNSFKANDTDHQLSIIPEPGTFALVAGALGLALVMIRRRRA